MEILFFFFLIFQNFALKFNTNYFHFIHNSIITLKVKGLGDRSIFSPWSIFPPNEVYINGYYLNNSNNKYNFNQSENSII